MIKNKLFKILAVNQNRNTFPTNGSFDDNIIIMQKKTSVGSNKYGLSGEHPFIETMEIMLKKPQDISLPKLSFNRELTLAAFKNGIEIFTKCANRRDRGESAGEFSGLYYRDNLCELWNEFKPFYKICFFNASCLCPGSWIRDKNSDVLIYIGKKPSKALDELVQGPTVIECGMFVQLAIWFGIRNMLEDELFDKYFGEKPLIIGSGNCDYRLSLSNYFSKTPMEDDEFLQVRVAYISNDKNYHLKHPAGCDMGQNVIVINDNYYCFVSKASHLGITTYDWLERSLRESFLAQATIHDMQIVTCYAQLPDNRSSKFGGHFTNRTLLKIFEHYHSIDYSPKIVEDQEKSLYFSMSKFLSWIEEH